MTRDAEMTASDFVALVLRGLAAETDVMAAKQLPSYVQLTIEQFAHPTKREQLRDTWEKGFWEMLRAAEPGSDQQLSFLRAFAGTIGKRIPPTPYSGAGRSDEALDFLDGLLDGSTSLPDRPIDTDLRWMILIALASRGRADRARIDGELARDNTIAGRERAAAAIAVMPDEAAKAESWETGAVRPGVANETQRSVAYVFDTAGQPELLTPYLDKFLDAAGSIWEERGVQIASTALEYMFPRSLISQETLDRVDAWLESSDANPAAKRFVLEGRADIARALKARAADA
jgi:aminopeptidase N